MFWWTWSCFKLKIIIFSRAKITRCGAAGRMDLWPRDRVMLFDCNSITFLYSVTLHVFQCFRFHSTLLPFLVHNSWLTRYAAPKQIQLGIYEGSWFFKIIVKLYRRSRDENVSFIFVEWGGFLMPSCCVFIALRSKQRRLHDMRVSANVRWCFGRLSCLKTRFLTTTFGLQGFVFFGQGRLDISLRILKG